MGDPRSPMVIFTGQSHPSFAKDVCTNVGVKMGDIIVRNISSTETEVKLQESIRGKEVFIIQSGSKRVNNDIFELLTMIYACRTSSAGKIVAVLPYLPYSKQCRMRRRACITSKLLAKLICNAGVNHIITMDLHQREIHGFFDCSVDNLRSSPFLLQYILDNIPGYRDCVMVARHPSSARQVSSYAERLRVSFAVIHGELKMEDEEEVDGRTSPPPTPSVAASNSVPVMPVNFVYSFPTPIPPYQQKVKPSISLVGSVQNKIAIILDDNIDDVEPWCRLAGFLKEQGARSVYAMATHGILSGNALHHINKSSLDQVVITNTVPLPAELEACSKVSVVDVSKLFAEAIRRIHNGESMSALFKNVTEY